MKDKSTIDLPFFKFSPSHWIFGKIYRQTDNVKGMFMDIICRYWFKRCDLSYKDACNEFDKKTIDLLISKNIIKKDRLKIRIEFLDDQFNEIKTGLENKSKKGKEAVEKRWSKNRSPIGHLYQTYRSPIQEKKRKEKNNTENLSDTTPADAGRSFRDKIQGTIN